MSATLNHVGVIVDDLEESIRFYEELFGLERLATPAFSVPVVWLRAGDLQVHLTERPGPHSGHFALSVDDLGAVYRRANETGALWSDEQGRAVYILPSGEVQLYVRDPSGNVIEANHHDAERWRDEIPGMVEHANIVQQPPGAASATLFLPRRGARRTYSAGAQCRVLVEQVVSCAEPGDATSVTAAHSDCGMTRTDSRTLRVFVQ